MNELAGNANNVGGGLREYVREDERGGSIAVDGGGVSGDHGLGGLSFNGGVRGRGRGGMEIC